MVVDPEGRSIQVVDMIQGYAPRGVSGGAVLNLGGEVVGIGSTYAPTTGLHLLGMIPASDFQVVWR